MDPEYAALIAALPRPPPGTPITLDAQREMFRKMALTFQGLQAPNLPHESKYTLTDHVVSVEDGEITVRALVPTSENGASETFPLLVWIHGGGWALGSINLDDYFLRQICVELQISIINVEYRLAPEHLYPTGINDCVAATKWAVENAPLLSVSVEKGFIVGGLSAGANGAAIIAHQARDDPFFVERQPTGQLLLYPWLCHPDEYPKRFASELVSMEQNAVTPAITRESAMKYFEWLQAPKGYPGLSVLLADHHEISPAFIQVAGFDPLRDEGVVYSKLLNEAGVETKLEVYQGLIHGGHALFPQAKVCQKFVEDHFEGLRWLLSRTNGTTVKSNPA